MKTIIPNTTHYVHAGFIHANRYLNGQPAI